MLILGIVVGLALGLLAGGTLGNLASIRLRSPWLLAFAVVIRYGTEAFLNGGNGLGDTLRLPLLTTAFAFLLVALWINRSYPGLSLAFVGTFFNASVIVVNGGYMPIWEPSLHAAGFQLIDVSPTIHTLLPPGLDASFLLHLGPLADVIPIPLPVIQNVASVGDAFLTAGLAFFLFAGIVRVPQELTEEQLADRRAGRVLALAGGSLIGDGEDGGGEGHKASGCGKFGNLLYKPLTAYGAQWHYVGRYGERWGVFPSALVRLSRIQSSLTVSGRF